MNLRIKSIRQHFKKTQKEFGESLGVSRDTFASYESGRVVPKNTFIQLLCSEYNVNEGWLRTGEGEMLVQISRDEEVASFVGNVLKGETETFKRRLISMLSRLDEADWEVLEKMAEKIKKD